MAATPPKVFGFTSGFEAYTTRTGLRRRHTVVVGMLLWEFLEPDERRAVVAHELAYQVVGDAMPAALDKLRFETSVEFGFERSVRTGDRPLLTSGRRRLEELTPDQIAAIRGADAHLTHSVDSTHPPTTERIEVFGPDHATALRGARQRSEWQRIDAEMDAVRDHMETVLVRAVAERSDYR